MFHTSPSPKPTTPPLGPIERLPPNTKTQGKPTEPNDVLGRHKNTGQKDHKGAR